MEGIDFLFSKLGEFLPDLDRGGADRLPEEPLFPALPPLPLPAPPPPLVDEDLLELKEGETDFDDDPDLLDVNDEEIEDGIFNGFNFTVGVFLKLLLCKSVDDLLGPPLPALEALVDKAGEVFAEEGADRDTPPAEEEELLFVDETLGEMDRPLDGAYDGKDEAFLAF